MKIKTNKLEIEYNIDAIEQDFAFIQLKRDAKGGWRGAYQLDRLIGDGYKADAVLYAYSSYAYAMFRRPVDIYELISRIRKDEDFSEGTVIEAKPSVFRTGSEGCICEAWLARILINSLASSRSPYKEFHYCNLTGALLIVRSSGGKNKDYIDAFEVALDRDYLLNAEVKRHRTLNSIQNDPKVNRSALTRKPKYVLHGGTGTLRRLLPRDPEPDPKMTYIQMGLKNKRAHAHFVDFSSRAEYDRSRAGVLHHVLDSIQEHLSKYMSVKLHVLDRPHTVELKETILKKSEHLRSRLDGQPVRIVDRVGSHESLEMIQSLKKGLLPFMGNPKLLTIGKREKKEAFNYRIIHDAAYYEENSLKDEYLASDSGTIRQNITIEGVEEVSDAIAKTLIKEQLIKRDLQEQKLSLFDWSRLNATGMWTFAAYDGAEENIIFMDIFPDGRFGFREVDPTSLDWYIRYQEYVDLLKGAKDSKWQTHLSPEGFVVSETGDQNLIYRTDQITIPNLKEIRNIIREMDGKLPEGMRTGSDLASVVKECFAGTPQAGNEKVSTLVENLNALRHQEISKKDLKGILNSCLGKNSRAAEHLRDTLYEKYRVRLHFSKKKESMDELFSASLNIKYFGANESEAHYFVGERHGAIQFSINNACHLRKIVAVNGSKLVFQEILPTMDVDFVRTGQSTVLPFPFKYIREYAKFEK